jgi:hypothetical protein
LKKIKTDIKNQMPQVNATLFTKEKFKEVYEDSPKKLRKLEVSMESQISIMLSFFSFPFILILLFSFCTKDKDSSAAAGGEIAVGGGAAGAAVYHRRHRINNYDNCGECDCGEGDCNCNCNSGGGNGDGAGILVLLLIILVAVLIFIILFFAVKGCGKKIARYIGIIGELVINLVILIMFSIFLINHSNVGSYDFKYAIIICIISSVLTMLNFLAVLLPNVNCCKKNEYNDEFKKPFASNEEQTPANSDFNNNPTIPSSPVDITPKENNSNEPIYLPINYAPNGLIPKPVDDYNINQEYSDNAPPSVQAYPQPQSIVELPSEEEINSKL